MSRHAPSWLQTRLPAGDAERKYYKSEYLPLFIIPKHYIILVEITVLGGMDNALMAQMKELEEENRNLKDVCRRAVKIRNHSRGNGKSGKAISSLQKKGVSEPHLSELATAIEADNNYVEIQNGSVRTNVTNWIGEMV